VRDVDMGMHEQDYCIVSAVRQRSFSAESPTHDAQCYIELSA
jgi:hypothetical protein